MIWSILLWEHSAQVSQDKLKRKSASLKICPHWLFQIPAETFRLFCLRKEIELGVGLSEKFGSSKVYILTKALVFLPSFVLLFSVIIPIPFYLFATTRFAVSLSFSNHAFHQRKKSYVLVINCCSGRRTRRHEILGEGTCARSCDRKHRQLTINQTLPIPLSSRGMISSSTML